MALFIDFCWLVVDISIEMDRKGGDHNRGVVKEDKLLYDGIVIGEEKAASNHKISIHPGGEDRTSVGFNMDKGKSVFNEDGVWFQFQGRAIGMGG